jgi:hypothetical protein
MLVHSGVDGKRDERLLSGRPVSDDDDADINPGIER